MSDVAIRVEGLGKEFRLRGKKERYRTLRDTLADAAMAPVRMARSLAGRNGHHTQEEVFWALKDVSFEVKRGEVVGVIGRNGAGKSTLLKILSRITEPTEGYVDIYGRVGSLLEVGTGFHPELSGRENIFLNGAILGMRRAEIERQFDEIVAFAEVEKFIDTPVKHYSSGMYLRLAFAVAAHLEPEILIVDEVLAVGDAAFQRKCLDKMKDVSLHGRTVLFVSHNMVAITRLCERTILLDSGTVLADDLSQMVVKSYLNVGVGATSRREWSNLKTAPGNDVVRLRCIQVCTANGEAIDSVGINTDFRIDVEYEVLKAGRVLTPNLHFYNQEGVCVFVSIDQDPNWRKKARPQGSFRSSAWVPGNLLAEGTLIVSAAISTFEPLIIHCFERDVIAFQVIDSSDDNTARGDFAGTIPGVVRPLINWRTNLYQNRGN